MTEKFKLARHQKYGIASMDGNTSLAIFYEAGTGKTMVALGWIYKHVVKEKDLIRVLVVCPASMVGSWHTAIDKMLLFEGYDEEGVAKVKKSITITSFQKTYKSEKKAHHHKDGQTTYKKETRLRTEVDREWGAVIIDESHCIGAHDSTQTKAALTLGRLASRRYILSGTPVSGGKGKEDFQKLYGQFKFLMPDIWKNWTEFKSRYVLSVDPWGKPYSYQVEACRALMRNYGIVARLMDCYDMPERIDTMFPCELVEKKVYKDIQEGNIEKYGIEIDFSGLQYQKLLQLCSGSIKREKDVLQFDTSKDTALKDVISGTDDKVVVFCNYRASIDRVERIARGLGKKTVIYDGRSKGETWREFQFGDAEVLVSQYKAGGTGLDLFASHTMVFFEPCTSALDLEQTRARIHRKGQTHTCNYIMFVTPKTIEEKVWNTVISGVECTRDMLNQWSKELYT